MNLLERVFEFFRKKEFYQVEYNDLNSYSIECNTLDIEALEKIKRVVLRMNNNSSIGNRSFAKREHKVFPNVNLLLVECQEIFTRDYNETYLEALQHKWTFNYFLMNSPDDPEMLIIANRVLKSDIEFGTLMYPLLVFKKVRNNYLLWDLLEKESQI